MKGKILKRVVAAALALLIVSGGVPMQPVADMFGDIAITANAEEAWSKSAANTVLGTTGIEHPQAPQENVEWRGNYVYYGKYNGNPVRYRILDADSQEFVPKQNGEPKDPTQKTMFLESDSFIGNDWNYGEKKYAWSDSVLKRYLTNTFYNKDGVFTPLEKSSIFSSVKYSKSTGDKADGDGYDPNDTSGADLYFEPLSNDTVFVLDAMEATNPYYGYANTDDTHKSRARGKWHWLRSVDYRWKGMVDHNGLLHAASYMTSNACPALNVNLKNVIFSSRISGDASDTYGKEYKLTLKNDKFDIGIKNGQYVTYNSSTRTVTVPYTVTDRDDNIDPNTVSVLITDLNDNIVEYHSLLDTYSASGTASFTLPTNAPQNYHVYLLAETRNDIHETDYASQPVEIHVPTTYGITYKLNGGTNNYSNPSTYIDDSGVTLYEPTRNRYTFGGWYDNSAFNGEPITSIPAGSTGRKTLYAKWDPCIYSVTLNLNGGTLVGENVTQYTYGVGAVLPEIKRDHYTFGGWCYRDQWGNEFKVTSISTTNYGDKSYYAKWSVNTYTIGYELNGGTVSPANPTTYNAETTMPFTLNNPTRTGYTFTGWTGTEVNGNSTSVEITDCSAGNRNYTANWSVHHYTVKFDKNNENATGSMADMNFTYDEEQTLTSNGFTAPTGYHFAGWSTSPDGNTVYSDTQAILNMTAQDNAVITLYAVWEANTYTIHFDKNCELAYSSMPDQIFSYDEQKELSANAFIYTTGEFLGWATSADGEVIYTNKQEIKNLTAKDGAEITLYAQWHIRYGIRYDSDLFTCRIAGEPNQNYWAHEGDSVQIYVNDATSFYTISVIDEDGNPVEYNAETYTFVMPAKEVWITVSSFTKNIIAIQIDRRTKGDDAGECRARRRTKAY